MVMHSICIGYIPMMLESMMSKEYTMTNNPHKAPKDNEAQTRAKPLTLCKLLGRVMLVALAIVVVNTVINANQNFSNRFKEGFYFEKYSDAEEARAALLKLHPIGTDIAALRSTLEKAGARTTKKSKLRELQNPRARLRYVYIQNAESYLYRCLWGVGVEVNSSISIQDISISMMGTVK